MIAEKNRQLAQRIAASIEIPPIVSIVLPPCAPHQQVVDEFGFVILRDASIGPFYTSLPQTLHECHLLYPQQQGLSLNTLDVAADLTHTQLARRAIALGAFNALSQHLFRRARFVPPDTSSIGADQPQAGETVAMVGYFKRLIRRLRALDVRVLVLEKNPQRVEQEEGVILTTQPQNLSHCQHILCTASTLINGTLESLLAFKAPGASFNLIGPSGSGLPDALFESGVDSVGGVRFEGDAKQLIASFNDVKRRGKAGRKYQLTPATYPSLDALLAQVEQD